MAKPLQHVKFYELEVGQQVIIEDDSGMAEARIVEIANGPASMFCSVEVAGRIKQIYFQKIYLVP